MDGLEAHCSSNGGSKSFVSHEIYASIKNHIWVGLNNLNLTCVAVEFKSITILKLPVNNVSYNGYVLGSCYLWLELGYVIHKTKL